MADDIRKDEGASSEKIKDSAELLKATASKSKTAAGPREHPPGTFGSDEDLKDQDDLQNVVFSCPVDHDGTAVYVKGWVRPTSEKRPIIIVHDLGENVGLYRDAARCFWDRGFSVYGFDLRGHGRSGRMLGHIPRFEALVTDLLQVVNWIRHKSERTTPFIIGQGLGALITVYFQRAYPKLCPAAALLSPCLTRPQLSLTQRLLIRSFAEISPLTRLPKSLTPRLFLSPQASKRGQFHGMTANFAKEVLLALDGAPSMFRDFSAPALILCPVQDVLIEYDKVFEMVGRHPRKAKIETRELQSAEHNVLTPENAELESIVDMMAAWFDAQERQLAELKVTPRQAASSRVEDGGEGSVNE